MAKKALGRGLGALINTEDDREESLTELRINDVEPNINQPRKNFEDEKLIQLAESIKQHGVVQPIVVKREKDTYKIVAGERRWRAARIAGLKTIPAIIKDLTDKQLLEIALIENLQREDLNPIEEAEAYENLIKEYKMTQEEISKVVGKSRSAIANSIRLLGLKEEVRSFLISGEISSGHARALLAIENGELQINVAKEIIRRGLNVRETENLVKRYLKEKTRKVEKEKSEEILEIEEKFKNIFGTKVRISPNAKKGKIMIEYYSSDELERIIELIMGLEKTGTL